MLLIKPVFSVTCHNGCCVQGAAHTAGQKRTETRNTEEFMVTSDVLVLKPAGWIKATLTPHTDNSSLNTLEKTLSAAFEAP